MKVYKFGGTSIGSPERMKSVAKIINDDTQKVVVLSAMSGTTNHLVEIVDYLFKGNKGGAIETINKLERNYQKVIDELYSKDESRKKGLDLIKSRFNEIRITAQRNFSRTQEKVILAQGELISTHLFHYYLEEIGIESQLIHALNFMRIDKTDEPDNFYIRENFNRELSKFPDTKLLITQGYICRDAFGEIDNLKRGGSDYTASLIGEAIQANEIQIWTDIDGIHNNDPRYVEGTYPIPEISFDEAAELAYFGAKILHPSSILPCQLANIPVRLKNTLSPKDPGTLITSQPIGSGIKAIAAKDGITAIKIKSGRMLLAYGFMRKVFEIFEKYKTSIDMVTTSEVAISITIDQTKHLNDIEDELRQFGSVHVDTEQTIICIVGDFIAEHTGCALQVFEALRNIPIRMISYGGSKHNVSVLINDKDKKAALLALNNHAFKEQKECK